MNPALEVNRSWVTEFGLHVLQSSLLAALSALLILLFLHFVWQYLVQGIRLRVELRGIARRVTALSGTLPTRIKQSLDDVFGSPRIHAAWIEYKETLHEQHEWRDGERHTSEVRATVSAQQFINVETIVDARIGSEYFKHLPGIMTGLGIIGTFFGLIFGLQQFDPTSTDSEKVVQGLSGLFSEVRYAFTFSGLAIGGAILVTILEKWLYSSCSKCLGEITQALDGLFRAGVGEEYLSGLLQASQDSASQTRQLKESLVEDLKVLLNNMTDRQIETSRQMTSEFASQIERSLQQPLQSIAETVKIASGQQSQAMSSVLSDLMTAFIGQMRESVGGQMNGLGSLMQETAKSMGQVELSLRSLVEDLRRAGGEQASTTTLAMRDLMNSLNEHQQQQGRAVAASTQVAMDKMQMAVTRMAEAQEQAGQQTQATVDHTVSAMQSRVDGLVSANEAMTMATKESMERIQLASAQSVDQLSASAVKVERAVSSLATVVERMTALTREIAALEGQTVEASRLSSQVTTNLATAAQAMSGSAGRVSELTVRFESIGRLLSSEVDQRAALLKDLSHVADRSREAGTQFARLTEQVEQQLARNVEQFGASVASVVSKNLTDYQKQLGDAVSMLKNALEELAEYADSKKD